MRRRIVARDRLVEAVISLLTAKWLGSVADRTTPGYSGIRTVDIATGLPASPAGNPALGSTPVTPYRARIDTCILGSIGRTARLSGHRRSALEPATRPHARHPRSALAWNKNRTPERAVKVELSGGPASSDILRRNAGLPLSKNKPREGDAGLGGAATGAGGRGSGSAASTMPRRRIRSNR
jgi:hypothetical protein